MNNIPKELELKYSIESFNIIKTLEAMTKQGYTIFKGRGLENVDRKSTRLNSSHYQQSRMPSSA